VNTLRKNKKCMNDRHVTENINSFLIKLLRFEPKSMNFDDPVFEFMLFGRIIVKGY
jgi:hypothetical protein